MSKMSFIYENLCKGDSFRKDFSRLIEIRSLIPSNVHMMALTAIASVTLRQSIIKILSMKNPFILSVSPHKPNIFLSI